MLQGCQLLQLSRGKGTHMKLLKVRHCTQVITPRNQQVLDLAAMLSIGIEYLCSADQYIYLESLSTSSIQMAISSQLDVHANDVVISSEVFTEILIDVASGTRINDALFKQSILISY